MILVNNLDLFASADTFNSRQVFVTVTFTVGADDYLIFGSGTKLFVTGKTKLSFSFSCFIEQVENVFLVLVSAASGFTC